MPFGARHRHVKFESTLPYGTPELMRASAFRRDLDDARRDGDDDAWSSRLSALSPSLLQDLMRFEQKGRQSELLEVLAATVRHARDVTVHVQAAEHVVPLTVFPVHRVVHSPLPMADLLGLLLPELEVLRVERAQLMAPDLHTLAQPGAQALYSPLGRLLWELALRGSRDELLPEISGQAAYRITPGLDLAALELAGTLASACERLKRQTTSLREISEWPGFDRTRAMRMLNGLYLQAGLMVTRTHPAATNEGWFGGSR
jgi:hypothetical protein